MSNGIGCAGGCGKSVRAEDVDTCGWTFLQITGRRRCGDCDRALARVANTSGGPSRDEPDTLPPTSIGALKKLPEPLPLHEKVKP